MWRSIDHTEPVWVRSQPDYRTGEIERDFVPPVAKRGPGTTDTSRMLSLPGPVRHIRVTSMLCLLAVIIPGAAAPADEGQDEPVKTIITLGIEPTDPSGGSPGRYTPVLRALERGLIQRLDTPIEVRLVMLSGSSNAVRALQRGTVDIARLETASYVRTIARDVTTQMLAAEHHRGNRHREGLVIVRHASKTLELDELRDRPILLGPPGTTLGTAVRAKLAAQGLSARDLDVRVHPTDSRAMIDAVLDGVVDAAVIPAETLRHHPDRADLRTLCRVLASGRPWVARAGLDPEVRRAATTALFDLTSPSALKALGCSGLLASDRNDYNNAKEMVALADRFNDPSAALIKP